MKRLPSHETNLRTPETRCRELRRRRKMTQEELAHSAGVSHGSVRKLDTAQSEEDLGSLYVTTLFQVAAALGVRPVTLWPRLEKGAA